MTDYEKFVSNESFYRAIGLYPPCEHDVAYFCTPLGAKLIGTLGVDGVSFCFVDGMGETVFCVSPSGTEAHYVFPIARDFREFLSLSATLGNAGTAEQIMCLPRERFYEFFPVDRNVFEQKSAELCGFVLTRIEDPWEYVRDLARRFNYSAIKFSDEYYEVTGQENPRGKCENPKDKKAYDFISTIEIEIKK